MSELLLELFSEEIPALMQKNAEEGYLAIFTKIFEANGIFANTKVFVGPRRITIYVTHLPKFIIPSNIEVKGPKVNAPREAIVGFCRSHNITELQLTTQVIQGQLYYVFTKKTQELDIRELFQDLLPKAINEYVWPKSMYWGRYNIAWVRPLKNILCIFDGSVLPIKFGHLTANNITYGHKVISSDPIVVESFVDYKEKLLKNQVILDRVERQETIKVQLSLIANTHNLTIKDDDRLLEEVTGLVEFPVVMFGTIPQKFLRLPHEVLITSMKTHQRYFSAFDQDGNLAPYFLFVSNVPTNKDIIVQGNEKVLSARLSDALYFYQQDSAKTLESRLSKLSQITFHTKLGSLREKIDRIRQISDFIEPGNQQLSLAALLCKSDLTSEMVGEFPELQGIMGYYYAKSEGLGEKVATLIRDHYKPQGPSDVTPSGMAAILALSDKLDNLAGLILAGEVPSGSRDPYSLRRQTLGIIRIILENKLSLDIVSLVTYSAQLYKGLFDETVITSSIKIILSFVEERAKFYFKTKYDIILIGAVLDLNIDRDLVITEKKLAALQKFLAGSEGGNLLIAYKRANNILEGIKVEGEITPNLFVTKHEEELFRLLTTISKEVSSLLKHKDFTQALIHLESLLLPISNFFDHVMVKDNNSQIANNRLLLLRMVCDLFHKIAKFDCL